MLRLSNGCAGGLAGGSIAAADIVSLAVRIVVCELPMIYWCVMSERDSLFISLRLVSLAIVAVIFCWLSV